MVTGRPIKKLKSKILIERIFKKSKKIRSGTLILHYLLDEKGQNSIYIGVGVSKKNLSLAVRRNRVKRQLRACIGVHHELILDRFAPGLYMFLFKGKKSVSSKYLEQELLKLIDLLPTSGT